MSRSVLAPPPKKTLVQVEPHTTPHTTHHSSPTTHYSPLNTFSFDDIMLSVQKLPAGFPSQAPPHGHRGSPQPEREPPPMPQGDSAPQLSKSAANRARRVSQGLPAKSGSGVRKQHYARPQGASQIARAALQRDEAAIKRGEDALHKEQVDLRRQQAVLAQEQRQVQMEKRKCVAAVEYAHSKAARGDRHTVSPSPVESSLVLARTPTLRSCLP